MVKVMRLMERAYHSTFLIGAVSIAMTAKGNDEMEKYRQLGTPRNTRIFRIGPLAVGVRGGSDKALVNRCPS